MKIILIEDDFLQAEMMADLLRQELESTVEIIRTEFDFCGQLEEIGQNPPNVFVIDVMLRWTDPGPVMTMQPRDVLDGGRERAGFRCQERLAAIDATREVPVILYSFFDDSQFDHKVRSLPPSAVYLQKESDPTPLLDTICRMTGIRR